MTTGQIPARVGGWLKHYPPNSQHAEVIYDSLTDSWKVYVGSESAGVVADGRVSDETGRVTSPRSVAIGLKGLNVGQDSRIPWSDL